MGSKLSPKSGCKQESISYRWMNVTSKHLIKQYQLSKKAECKKKYISQKSFA